MRLTRRKPDLPSPRNQRPDIRNIEREQRHRSDRPAGTYPAIQASGQEQ
jgi:hypothetical protein